MMKKKCYKRIIDNLNGSPCGAVFKYSNKEYIGNTIKNLDADAKVVVVGHHAPSALSIAEHYKDSHLMNGGFSSDLSEFILDNPKIKLWTHGHMHDAFDYYIGDTRVVCNPRGYPGERIFNSNFTIEV